MHAQWDSVQQGRPSMHSGIVRNRGDHACTVGQCATGETMHSGIMCATGETTHSGIVCNRRDHAQWDSVQ